MQPDATIEAAEVVKTLSGLMARKYYATSDKNDPAIRALAEAAEELNLPVDPAQLDSATLDALRAAESSGVDVANASGREVWKATLLYEVPQNE